MKRLLKIVLCILLVIVVAVGGLLGWLTVTEFKSETGPVQPSRRLNGDVALGSKSLTILSFNTGYAALSQTEDFFMDGGNGVRPSDKQLVEDNLDGILAILQREKVDITLLQEVDADSSRSFGIDETVFYADGLGQDSAFALNYSCSYVPYPLPTTIGKVNSGLLTLSRIQIGSADRLALPCPFSWPIRIANLKRCLLVTLFDIEGTDKKLAVINLHLEAYDNGEGKRAQTEMLCAVLRSYYEEYGWYVIAGGDFNQSFPGCVDAYPIQDSEKWTPDILSDEDLPEGLRLCYDSSNATCRLLDAPYNPGVTQLYVIDGFIVSDNVTVDSVEVLDEGFTYSDHNPVVLRVSLDG